MKVKYLYHNQVILKKKETIEWLIGFYWSYPLIEEKGWRLKKMNADVNEWGLEDKAGRIDLSKAPTPIKE